MATVFDEIKKEMLTIAGDYCKSLDEAFAKKIGEMFTEMLANKIPSFDIDRTILHRVIDFPEIWDDHLVVVYLAPKLPALEIWLDLNRLYEDKNSRESLERIAQTFAKCLLPETVM